MSAQFPASPEKTAPNLDWAPFGVVVFEVGAPFKGASEEFPQAIDERLFAHLALACSRELAMAQRSSEVLPMGVWRAWMEKTGAKSGVWRLLDLVESPVGIVPVALVEARLPMTADTAEEAGEAIAEWARRGQEERVPELKRSFLLPRFSRLIGMQAGVTSADGRPARAVIGQMISERESLALRQELAEPFSSTGGVGAPGTAASRAHSSAGLAHPLAHAAPPAPEGWDDGGEAEAPDDAPEQPIATLAAEDSPVVSSIIEEAAFSDSGRSGGANGKTRRL